jgi:hypothetical protein
MIKERDILGVAAFLVCTATAADFSVKTADQPAPDKIAEPIRAVLSSKSVQVLDGDRTVLRVWFRKEIPLKSKPSSPASSLNAIAETTLLGAVSVEDTDLRDYKDNAISRGVFTARFVQQPQDGDHLGSADFTTFMLLLSPDTDKALDSFTKYTPMVKASGKLSTTGHPVVLSLRPAKAAESGAPALAEPVPEHRAIRLKLPGKTPDGESAELSFDLVFEGHGHIQ